MSKHTNTEMEGYYDSDENVAYGPKSLKEIKYDLKKALGNKTYILETKRPTQRETISVLKDTSNISDKSSTSRTTHDKTGQTTIYFTPEVTMQGSDKTEEFLGKLTQVLSDSHSCSTSYQTANDGSDYSKLSKVQSCKSLMINSLCENSSDEEEIEESFGGVVTNIINKLNSDHSDVSSEVIDLTSDTELDTIQTRLLSTSVKDTSCVILEDSIDNSVVNDQESLYEHNDSCPRENDDNCPHENDDNSPHESNYNYSCENVDSSKNQLLEKSKTDNIVSPKKSSDIDIQHSIDGDLSHGDNCLNSSCHDEEDNVFSETGFKKPSLYFGENERNTDIYDIDNVSHGSVDLQEESYLLKSRYEVENPQTSPHKRESRVFNDTLEEMDFLLSDSYDDAKFTNDTDDKFTNDVSTGVNEVTESKPVLSKLPVKITTPFKVPVATSLLKKVVKTPTSIPKPKSPNNLYSNIRSPVAHYIKNSGTTPIRRNLAKVEMTGRLPRSLFLITELQVELEKLRRLSAISMEAMAQNVIYKPGIKENIRECRVIKLPANIERLTCVPILMTKHEARIPGVKEQTSWKAPLTLQDQDLTMANNNLADISVVTSAKAYIN